LNNSATSTQTISTLLIGRLKDYTQLAKVRLSMLVVFSSGVAFMIAEKGSIDWNYFWVLMLGGFLTTAASNAINQVIEKDYDALMNRTQNRPLPQQRLLPIEALLVAGIMGVSGIGLLWIYFNQIAALLSAIALLSYAFIYTPLKRFSPIAVFVGAFPGAIPPMIGWVAATGHLDATAFMLFGIQFMWQFPHFWSIAWVCYDDYLKAGYKLLPSKEGRSQFSAIQILLYIVALIPVSLMPSYLGLIGIISTIIILACGLLFLYQSINLVREKSIKAARQLMFGSFFYLPIVQLAIFFDKI